MNIVVFSPHPDDAEVLMGGTIAKYTKKGHNVSMVLVTIPKQSDIRKIESKEAASILGAKLNILDMDPYELGFNRKTVQVFDRVLDEYQPDVIYTSWIHDSHQDHVAVARATIASTRRNKCSLYMYEQALPSGMTPYAFRAQEYVDISDTLDLKIKSVLMHRSQVESFGEQWIESIQARAVYAGFKINVKYAEAFEIVKEIRDI